MRRTFLRNDKSKNVEKEASKLRDLLGCSDVVASNSTRRKIVFGSKIEDRDVEEQMYGFMNYIMDEQKQNVEQRKIFLRVIKRIAKLGKPDERCLDLLQTDPITGERKSRAKYRIGALLRNANIFLQFTRKKEKSRTVGWYPMKFDANSDKVHSLFPIKNMDAKFIIESLFCTTMDNINPRIICILKDKNGKRIVNGCIYDLKTIREKISKSETLPKIPTVQPIIMGCWERNDKLYIKDQNVDSRTKCKKKDLVMKVPCSNHDPVSPLPVMVMMENDENREIRNIYRKNVEEIMRESQIVSQDGSVHTQEAENRNETDEQNWNDFNETVCHDQEVDKVISADEVENNYDNNINEENCNNYVETNTNNNLETSNNINIVCDIEADGGDINEGRAVHISDTSA